MPSPTRVSALIVAAALLAPVVTADHEGLILLAARMDSVFDPLVVGPRWDFTFTVRNDGPERAMAVAIHEAPVVFDLMYTQWHEEPVFAAGETRTFQTRVDWSFPGSITFPLPDWFCLQVGWDEWPPNRCWSVYAGAALPNGVYPEDIPHWQLMGTPMGDMEGS